MIRSSRIGRMPVSIPSGVQIKIDGGTLSVKGPKGELTLPIHKFVKLTNEDNKLKIQANTDQAKRITGASKKLFRSIVGTTRANIYNLIHGVTTGFERKLVLIGVGYRASAKGNVVALSLGYSHPTDYKIPEGIKVETPTQTEILIKGADKELVGLVAAQIRSIRGPEPYKGKGIRYANETIELKETKKK